MTFSVADFIQGNEGLSLRLMPDADDTWQIGYGRNLSRKGITKDEAQYLFSHDLADAQAAAAAVLGQNYWQVLDCYRKAALSDMAYELGQTGLAGFENMIMAVRAKDWQGAHDACLASAYAREVPTRAQKVAIMLLTGEPP